MQYSGHDQCCMSLIVSFSLFVTVHSVGRFGCGQLVKDLRFWAIVSLALPLVLRATPSIPTLLISGTSVSTFRAIFNFAAWRHRSFDKASLQRSHNHANVVTYFENSCD